MATFEVMSTTPLSAAARHAVLAVASDCLPVLQAEHATSERPDWRHRVNALAEMARALECGEPLDFPCGDPGAAVTLILAGDEAPPGVDANFLRTVYGAKPPCAGDGIFRLEDVFLRGVPDFKATDRFREFVPSGFCVHCQIKYMEEQGLG
ncbi:hypothetical protein M885DRAFT_542389 [Pelagophyceae sp. CCMP2097]|nr:hypothetical protein M885DRAFT_542389 [Pelagophyceae sp. CCMP2097]|mmetsp:Transcript_22707/g.76719  ORF Transcript_22707/g.76719 Transcript_22707/m.76719 type:complete len:151 (-) Transcript_22707:58-510(-)